VNCGIMDQLISAGGQAGRAILVDCRSLQMTPVPLPHDACVVVLDTSTRRELRDSEYNDRRAQCAAAAASCGVSSLRDVDPRRLEEGRATMGELAFRRARHVLSENQRTLEAAEAMRLGDVGSLGRLMNESHRSLGDDFEVSTRSLDVMVESARSAPGCFGARLTGAGFGGCVVALVERRRLHAFTPHTVALYASATGLVPVAYPCDAADGAEIMAGA
jgi:galactokinase